MCCRNMFWTVWILPAVMAFASAAEAADHEDGTAAKAAVARVESSPGASNNWEFATTAYGWLAGARGRTDVIGPVDPVHVDLSFGDVIDSLKFVAMGAAEAKRDRFVLLGDFTFIHLGTKEGIGIRDPDFLEADLDMRTVELTALGGYRVADKGALVDLLGGVRTNFLKTSLELEGPNRTAAGDVSKTWFDPLVAGRAYVPLGGKFGMSLYGDIGGLGLGSDLTWQAAATVDYDINHKFRAQVGWRHFKVDFDEGDFLYDIAQSGLFLGLRTAW